MAAEPLAPVYLLTGSDRPKIARALQRLRARFSGASIEHLFAEGTNGPDAVAACNALGLFGGGGRLVIVEGVDRWKAADAAAVAEYLADPTPETVLALVAEAVIPSLAKAVAHGGEVLAWDVPKRRLPAWVAEQFARAGADADRDACEALVAIVGENLDALTAEIDKLVTWSGGEPVRARDVELLAVHAREAPSWALSDAWGERDTAAALAAYDAELHRTEPFLVGARLASHVAMVRSAQRLAAAGRSSRDIAKALGVHEFRVRKGLAHADRYTPGELEAAVVRLAELDAALKGGSRRPAELELELALVDVTRERVPA
ncbi:MAG: DNA polymerase III subunit delta [Thermoleophilia bacterium]|nr:DNA polymerase III subunit delta [Thermoleophilia bacterium]